MFPDGLLVLSDAVVLRSEPVAVKAAEHMHHDLTEVIRGGASSNEF